MEFTMYQKIATDSVFDELADTLGPTASWPTQILVWADAIAADNPHFNKEKFIERATSKWEEHYVPAEIDDHIPY
jgi:hypothetical protein